MHFSFGRCHCNFRDMQLYLKRLIPLSNKLTRLMSWKRYLSWKYSYLGIDFYSYKMAFLNPWNLIFLAKSILLKHYENGDKKIFSLHVPGSAKSRIYAGKSTKRGFSLMSNDEKKYQPIFQILHIKSACFLLKLAMALVNTIGMIFLQVCSIFWRR